MHCQCVNNKILDILLFDPVSILESRFIVTIVRLLDFLSCKMIFNTETRAICILYSYTGILEKEMIWWNVAIFLNSKIRFWYKVYFISFSLIVKREKGKAYGCKADYTIRYVVKTRIDRNKGFRACAVCISWLSFLRGESKCLFCAKVRLSKVKLITDVSFAFTHSTCCNFILSILILSLY